LPRTTRIQVSSCSHGAVRGVIADFITSGYEVRFWVILENPGCLYFIRGKWSCTPIKNKLSILDGNVPYADSTGALDTVGAEEGIADGVVVGAKDMVGYLVG